VLALGNHRAAMLAKTRLLGRHPISHFRERFLDHTPIRGDCLAVSQMRGFSAAVIKDARSADWLLEQTEFELSSPFRCAWMRI